MTLFGWTLIRASELEELRESHRILSAVVERIPSDACVVPDCDNDVWIDQYGANPNGPFFCSDHGGPEKPKPV
jgi:hypothetical protein